MSRFDPCATRAASTPADVLDWADGSPWDGLPEGMVAPEADVVVVPRPRTVARMDDEQLVAALVETEAAGRRVDALRAALAAEVAERSRRERGGDGLARRLGCRNAVELVQRTTGVGGATAGRRIRLGAAVRPGVGLTGGPTAPRFPLLAWALEEGVLGTDATVAVLDGLAPCERVAGRAEVAAAEAELVAAAVAPEPEAAPALDADSVRLQATVWRAVLDPDGAAPSAGDVERRGLAFGSPRHGLVPLRGMLMPEVAASLRRYADAWTNPRTPDVAVPGGCGPTAAAETDVAAPADGARADVDRVDVDRGEDGAHGDVGPDGGAIDELAVLADRRSRAQVLHDVLANALVVAARAADAPSIAGAPPTLVVTVRQEDLATDSGIAWADDTPVDLAVARHVAYAGAVERVVLGQRGRVVGLRSDERCFTAQQRRAIAVRDGACVIPGCHVPAGWCEVHHVVPHALDPTGTHTDNGVLLCWFHHRTLDTSGWEVRMRGGRPEVRPPGWLDHARGWRQMR